MILWFLIETKEKSNNASQTLPIYQKKLTVTENTLLWKIIYTKQMMTNTGPEWLRINTIAKWPNCKTQVPEMNTK